MGRTDRQTNGMQHVMRPPIEGHIITPVTGMASYWSSLVIRCAGWSQVVSWRHDVTEHDWPVMSQSQWTVCKKVLQSSC